MQLEGYKIQQDFYKMIVDAKTIGLNNFDIRKKLKAQGLGSKMINNLMNGTFTPINYSDARFKKKVEAVKRLAKDKTKESSKLSSSRTSEPSSTMPPALILVSSGATPETTSFGG